MSTIWNKIESFNISNRHKTYMFISLTVALSSLLGFMVWYPLHFYMLKEFTWMLCFIGYFGFFIGFIGGTLFLYNNDTKKK